MFEKCIKPLYIYLVEGFYEFENGLDQIKSD